MTMNALIDIADDIMKPGGEQMASVDKIVAKMKQQPNGIRLEYYLNLPYSFSIQRRDDEDGTCYVGEVLELDGCHSHGETKDEAFSNLQEAMEGYLEVKLEYGDPIPEPVRVEGFNGRFLLKLPKSLHQRLFNEANEEGVSLNQYALYKLSR